MFRASGSYTLFKDHGKNVTSDEPSKSKSDVQEVPISKEPASEIVTNDVLSKPEPTMTKLPEPARSDDPNAKLEISLFTFSRVWDSLRGAAPEERWKLLCVRIASLLYSHTRNSI